MCNFLLVPYYALPPPPLFKAGSKHKHNSSVQHCIALSEIFLIEFFIFKASNNKQSCPMQSLMRVDGL